MVKSDRSIRHETRSVEAFRTASECIGKIEKDLALFAVTRGQFSMIDAIQHCLSEMGPSRLTIWTWCIADYEMETFEWLLLAGGITGALLVIDRAGEQQQIGRASGVGRLNAQRERGQGKLMQRWKAKFGPESIKVCLNHAKIATLDNGTLKVLIRGSMNLNHNPRFEQLDITEGAGPFGLVHEIEESLPVLGEKYSRREVEEATGAHCLFTDEELKPFRTAELKIWAK